MYDYRLQMPNINVGFYEPRYARAHQLDKVDNIAVDTSALSRTEGVYIPLGFPSQTLSAIWLSAVINSRRSNKPNTEFLMETETDFMAGEKSPTDLLSAVALLNRKSKAHGWSYTLSCIGSWENLLLCLMEGNTVMVGGSVYESFQQAEISGIVPMPKPGEALLGGQIVNIVSFDQKAETGQVFGNMGTKTGRRGIFTYRGSYFRNLQICRDFFVLIPRFENAN